LDDTDDDEKIGRIINGRLKNSDHDEFVALRAELHNTRLLARGTAGSMLTMALLFWQSCTSYTNRVDVNTGRLLVLEQQALTRSQVVADIATIKEGKADRGDVTAILTSVARIEAMLDAHMQVSEPRGKNGGARP